MATDAPETNGTPKASVQLVYDQVDKLRQETQAGMTAIQAVVSDGLGQIREVVGQMGEKAAEVRGSHEARLNNLETEVRTLRDRGWTGLMTVVLAVAGFLAAVAALVQAFHR